MKDKLGEDWGVERWLRRRLNRMCLEREEIGRFLFKVKIIILILFFSFFRKELLFFFVSL